ncbi:hypothetical protein [Bremerella sp. P1]|uniref:hypothetical protein n=1 Tax=Bremerella sp. P1 TaxID=3026424 RepID=UPI0023684B85|nr:hypothetical protein [Bremerella sp. P1]WDI44776.1 hypothetical protein PSR63_12600 [Bremerella sp. P1]
MPQYQRESYLIDRAIAEIENTYGDVVSVEDKKKTLRKFGSNESVGSTTQATIMELAGSETNETFVYDNLIDSVSSGSTSNLNEVFVEGHTIASTVSVSSITRSSTTATVTTSSAHGLSVNDGVIISGANEGDYNKRVRVASVPTTTTFTYYVTGSPTTPATGTILARPVKYTFVTQYAYLNGQSEVTLSTPLATCTRLFCTSASGLAASSVVYAYDNTGVTLSSGVPDVDAQVHAIMNAADNQSRKASTTISNTDYWIISDIEASVNKKTAATVDVRLQVQLPYGPFRSIYPTISLASTGQNSYQTSLSTPIIVPKNSHFRFTGLASTTGVQVSAAAGGYLASVVS